MKQLERINDSVDIAKRQIEEAMASLRTATPGIVKGVDLEKQTVSVQVALQGAITDQTGEKKWVDIPLLQDVPIVWPRAGGFALTFPIKVGDECLVVFGERCIDAWWQSGGVQKPMDERMHDLSDAFAIFGITSQPRKLPNVVDNAVELRDDSRKNWISLRSGSLDINIAGPTTVKTTSATLNCETATVNASGSTETNCPTNTINGNLTVSGKTVINGGLAVSGGGGATVDGSMACTGDVKAGAISLQGHTHTEHDGPSTSVAK